MNLKIKTFVASAFFLASFSALGATIQIIGNGYSAISEMNAKQDALQHATSQCLLKGGTLQSFPPPNYMVLGGPGNWRATVYVYCSVPDDL